MQPAASAYLVCTAYIKYCRRIGDRARCINCSACGLRKAKVIANIFAINRTDIAFIFLTDYKKISVKIKYIISISIKSFIISTLISTMTSPEDYGTGANDTILYSED